MASYTAKSAKPSTYLCHLQIISASHMSSLGPQYVCTTFWTFVCTNCSGVHREFTHRVKSISMAKFSMEEVNALQTGGNELYSLRKQDRYISKHGILILIMSQKIGSNIHRIRDFIKHVYVDRQYTGETHPALVPRNTGMYGAYERRRAHTGDKFTFQEKSIERHNRYSYDEVSSPQHLRENFKFAGTAPSSSRVEGTCSSYHMDDPRENSKYGCLRTNSLCFENRGGRSELDGPRETSRYGGSRASSFRLDGKSCHHQVDNTRIAGRAATQMFTTEDLKSRRRSPDRKQSSDIISPTVGHVKEILGENSIALRVANNPKFADRRRCVKTTTKAQQEGEHHKISHKGGDHCRTSHRRTVSAYAQDTAESSTKPSSNAGLKPISGSAGSLLAIADSASPSDKPVQKPGPQTHAALKPPVKEKSCNAHPKNTLESLLLDLSTPAEKTPGDQSGIPCDGNAASSPSSSNLSARHHVPTPSTRGSAILPSGSGDASRVVPAQQSADAHTPSAAAATTSSNTLSTGMPERSSVVDTSKVHQAMQDLGDDGVPATEDISRKENSRTEHLEDSGTFVPDRSSASVQASLNEGTNNYPTMLYPAPSSLVNLDSSTAPSSQADQGPTRETNSSAEMHPCPADAKASRTELPALVFSTGSFCFSVPVKLMQSLGANTSNYGMGLNMHYCPPQMVFFLVCYSLMKYATIPNVAKSRNPFDTDDTTAQSHVNMFASQEFLQGGLTNIFTPSSMPHTTNFGSHLRGPAPMVHTWGNIHSNTGHDPGAIGDELGSLQSNQQIPYSYPAPTEQSSFPMGRGNPFG
ncbi:putative ADP-ribosylation factor GTPase-activating protein AGD14 [Bienertia sinuspersici]